MSNKEEFLAQYGHDKNEFIRGVAHKMMKGI